MVRGGEQFRVLGMAAVDGTNGMDDEAGLELVAAGEAGLARGASPQGAALGQQLGAGGAMDGAIHAASAQERAVGGVHQGVHFLGDDVALEQLHLRAMDGEAHTQERPDAGAQSPGAEVTG